MKVWNKIATRLLEGERRVQDGRKEARVIASHEMRRRRRKRRLSLLVKIEGDPLNRRRRRRRRRRRQSLFVV